MAEPDPPRHRRRERRREPPRDSAPAPVEPPVEEPSAPPRPVRKPRRADAEHGLRGIVGAGPSQVGVVGAMRARDAAKPTAADLADAEREVVVVRRHYVPPDSLPGAR